MTDNILNILVIRTKKCDAANCGKVIDHGGGRFCTYGKVFTFEVEGCDLWR